MSKQVVYVDHVLELLKKLARDHFSVMDGSYYRYLEALGDVESGVLKDIHHIDIAKTRTGMWFPDGTDPNLFVCSVCNSKVWYKQHNRKKDEQSKCLYPFCPRCRTPMEIRKGEEQ